MGETLSSWSDVPAIFSERLELISLSPEFLEASLRGDVSTAEALLGLSISAEWFESKIKQIHGRDWLSLNLRTQAADTEIRNIMRGTSLDNRLLIVTFNVTKELEKEWLEAGELIAESVRVSD